MASKSTSSTKQRSQGGGRTANSEPRLQVFKDFAGCNFQLSPRDFTLGEEKIEQSDLQMNYVVIQNNVEVTDNKTLETTNAIRDMLELAPPSSRFTEACLLIGNELFIGLQDGRIAYVDIANPTQWNYMTVQKHGSANPKWSCFAYVNDMFIAAGRNADDKKGSIWTSVKDSDENIDFYTISNSVKIDDPKLPIASKPISETVKQRGKLKVSKTETEECSKRVTIAWSYVNRFGPTKVSDQYVFYANTAVAEWNSSCYATIKGKLPENTDIEAVEIYFTAGNANDLQFTGRVDVLPIDENWSFDWFGYVDNTSMFPLANLIAPTENMTTGVNASRITCIDSRLYFWGDPDNPQRLWIGGNPGNLLSVSSATGGGFVDIDPGTGQEVRIVKKYKTQSGNSIVTMLCDAPNSTKEQRYNLVENTITLSNEQNRKSWQAEQVSGAIGCKSYYGAEVCEDGLYSISRYGLALTTMTMEYNSQIRANYVSGPIKPIFTGLKGNQFANSILIEIDGVIYMAFGNQIGTAEMDNIIFCYDIDLKAWWTITLPTRGPILTMFHVDSDDGEEGIGILLKDKVYLLPTTMVKEPELVDVLIQTGELATTQPQQNWQHISQLEFRFDYFVGNIEIEVTSIDMFGREIKTLKTISHASEVYGLVEYMRLDMKVQSYRIRITGTARFRMTHFMAKVYTMSSKMGLVWGFDDMQSYRKNGDIHPTFRDYNDVKKAIFP